MSGRIDEKKWPVRVALVFAAVGAALYFWLLFTRWGNLPYWGALGDAIAPIAGLANAFALGAAIWSVQMQRQELHDNREVMREQARHAEESSAAQREVAKAQRRANRIAVESQALQVAMEVSAIRRMQTDLRFRQAEATAVKNSGTPNPDHLIKDLEKQIDSLTEKVRQGLKEDEDE
jgi:hypothetical protein